MVLRLLLIAAIALPAAIAQDLILLADGDVSDWQYQSFSKIPETQYQTVVSDNGKSALLAVSDAGASGYTRRQDISLYDTPWLHFSWRVDEISPNNAEQSRPGDDFAWRLYFIGRSGLEYRALTLVYSQTMTAGTSWKSPYASWFRNLHLHALAQHDVNTVGKWQSVTVNVGELWREMFADDGEIRVVGFMTDADNIDAMMQTQYGEIRLSAEAAAQ